MANYLYYGDNLEVLRRYIKDDSVDLCYIDPPFNSKRNYNQIYNNIGSEDKAQAQAFIDTWEWDNRAMHGFEEISTNYNGLFTEQAVYLITGLENVLGKGSLLAYLVSMTLRITEIHRVLKPTGSFYLHCDPTASHYLKLVLDAVFCSQGGEFRNEIVWCYRGAGYPKKDFGRRHDLIFRYSKGKEFTFNLDSVREEYAETTKKRFSHYIGNKRGKKDFGQQSLNPLGKQPDDWWEIQPIAPSARERLGYPTQKPEALLERIIQASSNEGDIVLDAYCGCGTTVAVCEKFNRKWIGIDITYQSISLILKRLEDSFGKGVLETIKRHGIPKDMESAIELANKADDRTRKEFEKWAVLTYTNNRALINHKKGADQGVDGVVLFQGDQQTPEKMIFQVKSGKVKSGDIRDLIGTMTLQNASLAIFITLQEPTKEMLTTAKSAGFYRSQYITDSCDKIQIVTVKDIVEKRQRLNIRLSYEVLKSAEKQKLVNFKQGEFDL
ncbi:MAG: DNA methyltransferase [Limnospira sp. PMC 1291.21]|uniref:DNA methyltransferase n=1 Tax=unclassified Limnospira TaxID=2642885 RepID=UPI0028E1079C|nr:MULTISPECIES: DNA methyltransferase [unclassified Limnospira]MDT9178550.1 DNA methyltransferase [Limnospira sp. PMC 1238.20]MDT9193689.1 DNA methyltransferase [Limnospira sp. PMC 1245.20]MDT9203906.1 DNA methyltransferase [Limnospira sp. PMC 1243.20]MDT9209101.1 DNA methyltransferase [Limnospira sp. PMC 1252.20]MDT9214277.1 DNA methyltransferase [Limnospira sp. PMC 1256.20]